MQKRIPVDLCKRRRFNENRIFLSKGKLFRKEGEVRRRTLFRRPFQFDVQTNSTSQDILVAPIKPSSFNIEDSAEESDTDTNNSSDNREL